MNNIELHCCAKEKSTMSFPAGALCIKTAINQMSSLPKARLYEHYSYDSPESAANLAGTNITDAVAPVTSFASLTVLKTGTPRHSLTW